MIYNYYITISAITYTLSAITYYIYTITIIYTLSAEQDSTTKKRLPVYT